MGIKFNRFLIGYFLGVHLIYFMPNKYYTNFKSKIAVPFDKEYHKTNTTVLACAEVLANGMGSFFCGKESPYEEFIDYLVKWSNDFKQKKN